MIYPLQMVLNNTTVLSEVAAHVLLQACPTFPSDDGLPAPGTLI